MRLCSENSYHVNDPNANDEPIIAFGGEKSSGIGRFGGEWTLEKFTTVKM